MLDLDELMKLREAATPGPWRPNIDGHISSAKGMVCHKVHVYNTPDGREYDLPYKDDSAYICAACNAVPELVARIRKLDRQLEFWKRTAKKLAKNYCFICHGRPKECPRENDNVRVDPIPSCRLKHARRVVKNEMFVNAKVAGRRKVNDDI